MVVHVLDPVGGELELLEAVGREEEEAIRGGRHEEGRRDEDEAPRRWQVAQTRHAGYLLVLLDLRKRRGRRWVVARVGVATSERMARVVMWHATCEAGRDVTRARAATERAGSAGGEVGNSARAPAAGHVKRHALASVRTPQPRRPSCSSGARRPSRGRRRR